MRVAIASRIYAPEPAAASFRLEALAKACSEAGHRVKVLTTTLPPHQRARENDRHSTLVEVARFPVLRDRNSYVRGYLQYLSFDIPLFFRILLGRRMDVIVVEPPPTSWLLAALASRIRRTPYFLYAADIWSDATESTGAPSVVTRAVRCLERIAMKHAAGVFAVNDGVRSRAREISPLAKVHTVGNGVDTSVFQRQGDRVHTREYAIYSGTASEWQGAEVFVRAAAVLAAEGDPLEIIFLGQGSAFASLRELAHELHAPITFLDTVAAEEAAAWMRGAVMSLASIRPGEGYDFAYPTKLFASWACGTPTLYAGPGPAREELENTPFLGLGVEYETSLVAEAMRSLRTLTSEETRKDISVWARANVSLSGVAQRAMAIMFPDGSE